MPYPIVEIFPESSERIEQLGSKPKFWFRWEGGQRRWLFKYARSATGEHWTEKVGAEVAHLLGVPHAIIELAEFGGKRGSASPSFVPPGIDLIHGNEILAGRILGYDAQKKFRQSDHTLNRIVKAFDIFPKGPLRIEALTTLAGYLMLDAIVCNVDRHHENWGILRSAAAVGKLATQTIAPTFDHASSLGRELRDEKRRAVLDKNRVAEYVSKGSGAIYWKETDLKGENPLALCTHAARIHRTYFQRWIDRVKNIAPEELEVLVSDVPDDWMSPIAKQFAKAILSYTTNELRKL